MSKYYDVIVIGAGSAGLTSAVGFTKIGRKVLLVEKEHRGGEYTNSGCVPSKVLLHYAKTYYVAKQAIGDNFESLETYRRKAFSYTRAKIEEFLESERPKDFEKIGMDVVMCEVIFDGAKSLHVRTKQRMFKMAIVATGSSPRKINIKGLSKKDVVHNAKKHLPKIIALILWSVIIVIFYQYRITHNLSFREMLIMLYDAVTTTAWGPIVYIFTYAIRPLIFFPATLLTALSGLLFGLPLGILYTVIGENASANMAYWIGRFFGKDLALENSFMGKWISALRVRPFMSVLFMRLFYMPFDLTNYGAGILHVRWVPYALATVIGIMPGLTTFVALGAGIKDIRTFELSTTSFDFVSVGIAVSVFVIALGLSRVLKQWHNKQ